MMLMPVRATTPSPFDENEIDLPIEVLYMPYSLFV